MKVSEFESFQSWHDWMGRSIYVGNSMMAKTAVLLFFFVSAWSLFIKKDGSIVFLGAIYTFVWLGVYIECLYTKLRTHWRAEARRHAQKWINNATQWFESLPSEGQEEAHKVWSPMESAARQRLQNTLACYYNRWWIRFSILHAPGCGSKKLSPSNFSSREREAAEWSGNPDLLLRSLEYAALYEVGRLPVVWRFEGETK